MNRSEIEKLMPHRDGMLLIDEAEVTDGIAHAKKTIRPDEWFLRGHFPDNPVVPGVVLCEIMAQSVCVLLSGTGDSAYTPYLTGLSNVRFKNPVRPGDKLDVTSSITKSKGGFYFATGTVSVDGKLCASGEFSFAVIKK